METTRQFQTIKHTFQIRHVIQKSRFIASAQEVKNEDESRYFLKLTIKNFPDATHHCWAYRLGNGDHEISHYSDDGEPANSAGPPILQAIMHEDVTNVMIVVARYFGGKKLGISGLIQAYRNIALELLKKVGKKKMIPLREFNLDNIDYQYLGKILQSLESHSGHILNIEYGQKVKLSVDLPEHLEHWMIQMFDNLTRGSGNIYLGEIKWCDSDDIRYGG
ncbi:MAG: YigZ family protein [Candidatus Atribacteria bacterium]|nr:YigZ family protein [Candidatus Atribacteria bacterium]